MKVLGGGGASLLWLVVAVTTSSCIYDSTDRCSPGEEADEAGYCVCPEGSVPRYADIFIPSASPKGPLVREGCEPCGEHELVDGEACVCEPGFVRAGGEGACEKAAVPDVNYGDACTDDTECTGEGATCILDDTFAGMSLREGYCSTRGCEDATNCPADKGFGCYPTDAGKFCRRAPTGEGDACDPSQGDVSNPACTGEASSCGLSVCTSPEICDGDDTCTPGLKCCDLTAIFPGVLVCMEACPL